MSRRLWSSFISPQVSGIHTHGVNAREALLNPQYFSEAVAKCEEGFAKKVSESRQKTFAEELAGMDEGTKEYLYRILWKMDFGIVQDFGIVLFRVSASRPSEILSFSLVAS